MNAKALAAVQDGQSKFFGEPPDFDAATESFREATRLAPEWSEGFGWLTAAAPSGGRRRATVDSINS
jgi:hypothetical protein